MKDYDEIKVSIVSCLYGPQKDTNLNFKRKDVESLIENILERESPRCTSTSYDTIYFYKDGKQVDYIDSNERPFSYKEFADLYSKLSK